MALTGLIKCKDVKVCLFRFVQAAYTDRIKAAGSRIVCAGQPGQRQPHRITRTRKALPNRDPTRQIQTNRDQTRSLPLVRIPLGL